MFKQGGNYGIGNTVQHLLTSARLACKIPLAATLNGVLFKLYLQHIVSLFLSLPEVADILPHKCFLMLEQHPNKHHLSVVGHVFRVCINGTHLPRKSELSTRIFPSSECNGTQHQLYGHCNVTVFFSSPSPTCVHPNRKTFHR